MGRVDIVASIMDRCKSLIEDILDDSRIKSTPAASLVIFEKFRDVCREILQAWVDECVERLACSRPSRCSCSNEELEFVHIREVTLASIFGPIVVRYRQFRCKVCKAYLRPDDKPLGIPEAGVMMDDIAALYEPLAAELPHRTAADLLEQLTGVSLSSRGAQGLIDRTAEEMRKWREVREEKEVAEIVELRESGEDIVLEVAMDGVMANVDGAWQEAKVATFHARRRGEKTEDGEPKLGRVVSRRYACVLGPPELLEVAIRQTMQEACLDDLEVAEVLGDGAPWIWNLATTLFPDAHQTLDVFHLREHLYEFANAQYKDPCRAEAWVETKVDALKEDRVGDVLGGLKKMRVRKKAARKALHDLIRYVENNKTRIRYQEPWDTGLAVGSGAVEG